MYSTRSRWISYKNRLAVRLDTVRLSGYALGMGAISSPDDRSITMATPQHAMKVTRDLVDSRRAMVEQAPTRPTINGKPATVSGYRNRFATVTDKATGLSAEWTWEAVAHIMANRFGAFKS